MINPWLLICFVANALFEWLMPRPTEEQLDEVGVLVYRYSNFHPDA